MDDSYIVLQSGGTYLAVNVAQARQVRDAGAVTPVPGSPAHVAGVCNLDGQITPVINLAKRLGLESDNLGHQFCIVEAASGPAALAVHEVLEVISIAESDLRIEESACGVMASAVTTLTHWRDEPLETIVLLIDPEQVCEAA